MIQKTAMWAIIGGFFATLLIPFIVSESMFFPFITGKGFAFRIITEIMLAGWLILLLYNTSYRPKRSLILIAASVFTLVVGIADVFGVNMARSFWSNFERMEGYVLILHLIAYVVVVGSVIKTEKIWKIFLNTSIVASLIVCFNAFGELSSGIARVDATLGNATYLAVYLLFNIFIALFLAYRGRGNKVLSIAYLVAIAIQTIALYHTGTRGTLLGLAGGLGIAALIVLVRGHAHPTLRKFSGIAIGVALALSIGFFMLRDAPFVKESTTLSRIANISLQEATVQSRFVLWTRIGWDGFKERPLLGWGQDNFIVAFGKYYDPIMYKQEPWFDRAHNVFMDWLIAGGIVGLLSYLFLFGAGVYLLWKTSWSLPEKALLTGLFTAYAIHNFFVFDNLISYFYFFTILAYLHVHSTTRIGDENVPSITNVQIRGAFSVGIIIALVCGIAFLNSPYIARSHDLIESITLDYQKADTQTVLTAFTGALGNGTGLGADEVREQLMQSAIRAFSASSTAEGTRALVERAEHEWGKRVTEEPANTRSLYFLGRLLTQTDQEDEGVAVFEQALAINRGRQIFWYEIGQSYLDQKKYTEATDAFKSAYDAEQENGKAFAYYAATIMHSGKFAEGERLLMEKFGTTTVDNELLFQAYERFGRNDKIAEIFELRLHELEPNDDASLRVSLALVYNTLGRTADAIAQLERAGVLRPDFKAQADDMIRAIQAGKKIIIK